MKLNWNFLGGGVGTEGAKQKSLVGGSMDIFWNCINRVHVNPALA